LALLGKIFRKTNRKERALQYFRMSLQLDPFLFTSFQALAELGDTTLDASNFFGGTVLNDRTNQFLNTSNFPQSTSFRATDGAPTAMPMKTPLQPMMSTPMLPSTHGTIPRMGGRAIGFETPDLTPITRNNNDTFGALNHPRASMTPMTSVGSAHGPPPPMESNQAVFRRAKHVAGRQYYPPSPDTSLSTAATPVTSVTRSMRYLRGLGTGQDGTNVRSGRSLFPSSLSENQAFNQGPSGMTTSNSNNNQTIAGGEVASLKPEKTNDAAVQEILDILTILGAAYHHLCQYRCREALQLLQQLPSSQQLTPWVLHQEGRAFLEQGDFFSAQRCFEFMQSVDPGRMQGLELLSTVYWQLKKEIDLANLAQRAMDWDFLSPQAHCVAGNCFSLQKDHETALVFFKRSLQLDPTFTYTHTLSGYEYMANEDFGKATSCFRKALQTDDRHYNAWYGLGMIYYRQEKYDLAEYHFERAVSIHPTSGVLRCNLGMAQNANGKAYVALESLSEAFRLDPRNPQARFQRATIYSALHRHEEALKELTIVRDAAPREATVHFAMGKILKRLGRLDEAMKCFLTAMDLDPKDNQLIKSAMDKLGEPEGDEESTTNY
jgi:anaphase-promoting complex subunit 3